MKPYFVLIMIVASLLLAACVPHAPIATPLQPTVAPAATPEPAAISASPALSANSWQWTGFTGAAEQFKVEQPANYQLTFNADGTVNIKADCNNATGSYTSDDSSVTIQVGPMTMAACPEGSRSDQFVKLLGGAAKYFFADGNLFIDLMADGGTLRFDPAGAPAATDAAAAEAEALMAAMQMFGELTAQPWKWTAYATGSEKGQVETPANYTLTFQLDGSVAIKADCNNAVSSFSIEATGIAMKVGPATLAACPPPSRGEQFLQLLNDVAGMMVFEGKLYVQLKTDDGVMVFEPDVTTVADLCGEKALAINTIDDTLPAELSAQLDQRLVQLVKVGGKPGPGAVMLIITPNGRYLKSTGVADVKTCEPLKADSPFQIGSNTKMMTTAMIYQLQEEGKLSTSDLLSKWLPDLAAKLLNGDKFTIEMLLTHTSGMVDYFDVEGEDGSIEDGATDKAMLTRAFIPEELVEITASSGASEFAPAAEGEWKYNNTGYILLGLVIEKVTGKTYEENLKERIFEPLGLKQTYLQRDVPEAGALPNAYYKTPFDFATGEWNASQGWSAGAVVSTPDEFATFMKALFTGKLFKQGETLELMQAPTPASADRLGPGVTYAHGMTNNNGVLGHGGQTLGFQSDGGYVPDKDVTIVMWSNAAESNVSRAIVPGIAAAVSGTEQTGQAAPAAAPRYEPLDDCFAQPQEGFNLDLDPDCGYVVVPESRSGASEREVKLGFTRLNSGKGAANSPLFMLAGGPGQAQAAPLFFTVFQPELLGGILAERDIVLVEQRGTEHTDPFLNCPEALTASWTAYEQGLKGEDADNFAVGLITDCIEQFKAQGVNFDAYNSVENAADVNAVREALGYDKIIYYGASYGAQLGQHVMRDFPEMLEAVVLDGAEALSRKSWVENRSLDAQWGIDNLTKMCEADAKCKEAYDVPALVDAALALFDDGPLPYTYTDPTDPSLTIEGEVTLRDMVDFIYNNQTALAGIAGLPLYLKSLVEGGPEAVAEFLGAKKASDLLAGRTATTGSYAFLMHVAMVCSDDPVKSVDEVKLDGAGRYATLRGQAGAEEYIQLCTFIDVQELPDSTDVDVTTDVPVLLLSGELDVQTPTFQTQKVADALPNATLVVFPGRTHVQLGGSNLCAGQIMTQFVLDPTAKLDTSCLAEAPVVGFALPDGSSSKD